MTNRIYSPRKVGPPSRDYRKEMVSAFTGAPPLGLDFRYPMLLRPMNLTLRSWPSVYLRWDWTKPETVDLGTLDQCLWDFVALGESIRNGNGVDETIAFVNKWGVLEDGRRLDEPDGFFALLDPIMSSAREVLAIIETLIASESGELISDSVYEDLCGTLFDVYGDRVGRSLNDIHPAEFRLFVQKGLVDQALSDWIRLINIRPSWENGTRDVSFAPQGAKQIIGYGLLTLYASPDVDVYTCSICGRMYRPNLKDGRRRPRRNARRYCGPECASIGTRESKRASYHRRKNGSSAN